MTDVLLELGKNPFARRLVASAKLPIPMPQGLVRLHGARPERFLEGKAVLVSGASPLLTDVLSRTLSRAGATSHVDSAALAQAFVPAAEAYGRPTKLLIPDEAAEAEPAHALLLDTSSFASPEDLKQLYLFLNKYLPRLARNGRVVLLAREPDEASTIGEAAARTALDGFTRSLAKELGGRDGSPSRRRPSRTASCSGSSARRR